MGFNSNAWVLFVVALITVSSVASSMATTYNVGDASGWTIMADVNYIEWASSKTFHVGDTIRFIYDKDFHNVIQVTFADYISCTATTPLDTFKSGNDSIRITGVFDHYYFIGGISGHCDMGLKVDFQVAGVTGGLVTLAPGASPSHTPPSPTVPTSPPHKSSPPPKSSGSTSPPHKSSPPKSSGSTPPPHKSSPPKSTSPSQTPTKSSGSSSPPHKSSPPPKSYGSTSPPHKSPPPKSSASTPPPHKSSPPKSTSPPQTPTKSSGSNSPPHKCSPPKSSGSTPPPHTLASPPAPAPTPPSLPISPSMSPSESPPKSSASYSVSSSLGVVLVGAAAYLIFMH